MLFSLTLLLSACQPISPSNKAAPVPAAEGDAALPDLGALQIAYVPVFGFVPLFVAAEKGYFTEQGLLVQALNMRIVAGAHDLISVGAGDPLLVVSKTLFDSAAICLNICWPKGWIKRI